MAIHTDNAIDSAEQDMQSSDRTRGPRSKYFACVAWKKKLFNMIPASSEEEASALFEAEHEVKPDLIDAGQSMAKLGGGTGYYLAKGTGMSDAQRISVTVSAEQMTRHTSTHIKAEFRGWIVYGNGIKGFKTDGAEYNDDELATILFHSPIDPKNKVAKPKLKKNEAVRMSDLKLLAKS